MARTNGTTTTRYSYSGSGDSAAAVLDNTNAIVDKTISLIGGVTVDDRGATTTFHYPNIHGDVMATADASGTKQGSTFNYSPFGESLSSTPDNETQNLDYGWLGSKQRQTEHEGSMNTIEMGQRQYVPGLGRFIEIDPIEGGSANDYDYVSGDPVGGLDLDGRAKYQDWGDIGISQQFQTSWGLWVPVRYGKTTGNNKYGRKYIQQKRGYYPEWIRATLLYGKWTRDRDSVWRVTYTYKTTKHRCWCGRVFTHKYTFQLIVDFTVLKDGDIVGVRNAYFWDGY